jgi:hypothetical protein
MMLLYYFVGGQVVREMAAALFLQWWFFCEIGDALVTEIVMVQKCCVVFKVLGHVETVVVFCVMLCIATILQLNWYYNLQNVKYGM